MRPINTIIISVYPESLKSQGRSRGVEARESGKKVAGKRL